MDLVDRIFIEVRERNFLADFFWGGGGGGVVMELEIYLLVCLWSRNTSEVNISQIPMPFESKTT
jgi:hypothetical protein